MDKTNARRKTMGEIKFRAVIPEHNINKVFWLEDLINPLFSTREFIIPWLLKGNEPDRFIGHKDKIDNEIYEHDILENLSGRRCEVICFISPSYCGWDLRALNGQGMIDKNRLWKGWIVIGNTHKEEKKLKAKEIL